MEGRRTRGRGACAAIAALLWCGQSSAHLDLLQPVPREQGRFRVDQITNTNLKEGPCGQRENGRTEKTNVFAPGETISLVWDEYVNHRSYYRVAFDLDGDDDLPRFSGPGVPQEGHDPRDLCPVDDRVILAYELNDASGGQYTLDVTLPDVECDNCTLQVIQYMYGRERARPYYFQCADLVLRRDLSSRVLDAGAGADASVSIFRDAGEAVSDSDAGNSFSDEQLAEFKAPDTCWQQLEQPPLPELADPPNPPSGDDTGSPPNPSLDESEPSEMTPPECCVPQSSQLDAQQTSCGCLFVGTSGSSRRPEFDWGFLLALGCAIAVRRQLA